MIRSSALLLAAIASCATASADETRTALAHPLFDKPYACMEHWKGNLKELGDALGTDCFVQRMVSVGGRTWMRSYAGNGYRNSDWYGFRQNVLSPCSCEVVKTNENPVLNKPGVLGKPPASFVMLKRQDGVFFAVAHVSNVRLKVGESVAAGQVIGQVGNNGYSRQPHIHLGAWKEQEPMQVRFDQAAMGQLLEK